LSQQDGVKDFWRETDVWIFSPLARINKLLAALLIAAFGIYLFGKTMPEWPATILSISTTCALGLLGLCCEMYQKGGRTAAKIKSELEAKNAWKRANKEDVIPIFHELATRSFVLSSLDISLAHQNSNPDSGSVFTIDSKSLCNLTRTSFFIGASFGRGDPHSAKQITARDLHETGRLYLRPGLRCQPFESAARMTP